MLILPKPLCDQYGIEKGMELPLIATDNGLYIPLKSKPLDNPMIEALESEIEKNLSAKLEKKSVSKTAKVTH